MPQIIKFFNKLPYSTIKENRNKKERKKETNTTKTTANTYVHVTNKRKCNLKLVTAYNEQQTVTRNPKNEYIQ